MKPSANHIEVKAMRLSHGMGLPLPQYQSEEAAGLDLLAAVPLTSPLRLLPGMRQLVPTGLTVEIPPGFEGQVRPRSGLALNHGVTVLNAPGTIDSDYRGEIKVLLINLGRETFVITRGQRIAQLVFQAVARAEMIDVRAVAASRRGEAGFGSTGLAAEAPKAPPAPRAAVPPKISFAPATAPAPQPVTKSAATQTVASTKIAVAPSSKSAAAKSVAAKPVATEKPKPHSHSGAAAPAPAAKAVAASTGAPAGKPSGPKVQAKVQPKAAAGKAMTAKTPVPAAKGGKSPPKKPPVAGKRPAAAANKGKVAVRA